MILFLWGTVMKLNFYMEFSAFIIMIFLGIATCYGYHVIDLKDRIFVRLIRILITFLGVNILSYLIIRHNIFAMEWLAGVGIYLSFFMLVWTVYYVNAYIYEVLDSRNQVSYQKCFLRGLPSLGVVIILLVNLGNHCVFEVTKVDSSIKVVFNQWYVVPYVFAGVSLITGMAYSILKNYRKIIENKQYILFFIPVLFTFAYYIQYRYKAVATFGFSCSFIMLLIYIYSYNAKDRLNELTALPNENSFKKMLEYRFGDHQSMTVLMLNINEFKAVNREYGHENGDLFIKMIADYLVSVSPYKCVAHFGGDRFGILLIGTDDKKVQSWIHTVMKRFEEPWKINKIEHKVSVSIVVAECPGMCNNIKELKSVFDFLLKENGKPNYNRYIIYDEVHKNQIFRQEQIASILKDVISNGNMSVVFQPIYDVDKNAYTRGEALFRLKDSTLGNISPCEFFPIAEEYGYVIDIGYVLLDKVCEYIHSFTEKGLTAPVISVNFSRQQLMANDVGEKMLTILKSHDLKPEHIAIEVPEDIFSVQYEYVKKQMVQLNHLGFRFYLDGFGAGFLDLSHLMELPFELIKINKKMIRDAQKDDTIYLLVSAMTAVFEENGISILGDGIESQELRDTADMLFMNYLQGYYYSEPISEKKATDFFTRKNVFEKTAELVEESISEDL